MMKFASALIIFYVEKGAALSIFSLKGEKCSSFSKSGFKTVGKKTHSFHSIPFFLFSSTNVVIKASIFECSFEDSNLYEFQVLWSDLPCKNFQLLLCVAVLETEKEVFYKNNFSFNEILKVCAVFFRHYAALEC